MRGLGAMRAETGSGSGDQCHLQQGQLPLAFFGCHSALGTKLRQEVGAGWRALFYYLQPGFPFQEAVAQTVLTKVSAQKERGGDGLTCTFTQKTHETSRVQRLTWVT